MDRILQQIAQQGKWEAHEVIGLIALSLVGGYAGEALMEASAAGLKKKVDQLSEDSATLKAENATIKADSATIKLEIERSKFAQEFVQRILKGDKLNDYEIQQFKQALNDASSSARWEIAHLADDNRRQNWSGQKERVERSLLIFEALAVSSEAKNHYWWYASLAYCLKDKLDPDYVGAVKYLEQAIKIRRDRQIGRGAYEFNRAYSNINITKNNSGGNKAINKKIETDLVSASKLQKWKHIIDNDDEIKEWKKKQIGQVEKVTSIRPG
jgi:hypothetical protein